MKSVSLLLICSSLQTTNSFTQSVHLHSNPPYVSKRFNNIVHNGLLVTAEEHEVRKCRCTALTSMHLSPSTITATASVAISAAAGFTIDKLYNQDSGLIITLVLAAILSNFGLFGYHVPSMHPIYDLCWSKFLPASLALTLFTSASEHDNMQGDVETTKTSLDVIIAVGIPFTIGSIGSILGCLFSSSLQVWAGSVDWLKKLSMSPIEASVAAGCLSASYIGGTVNFFAAARIISSKMNIDGTNNLISAMAAADLIVMAIYFGFMSKLVSWKQLNKWFPTRNSQNQSIGEQSKPREGRRPSSNFRALYDQKELISLLISSTFVITLAWAIIEISTFLETLTSSIAPGLQCAFVALFGSIMNRLIAKLSQHQSPKMKMRLKLKESIDSLCPILSDFCFYLLFSAIGLSADLKKAITYGVPCIVFASIALIVHIFTIYLGTSAVTNIAQSLFKEKIRDRIFPISNEEICVASNCAVGGASTAAGLAGNSKSHENKRGLVFAATIWGVIGYAVSTSIGVSISTILFQE